MRARLRTAVRCRDRPAGARKNLPPVPPRERPAAYAEDPRRPNSCQSLYGGEASVCGRRSCCEDDFVPAGRLRFLPRILLKDFARSPDVRTKERRRRPQARWTEETPSGGISEP